VKVATAEPALVGFELYGPIELTEGQLALPDSGDATTPKNLTFTVKSGTLTIGKNASLGTQTFDVRDAAKLVIDEKASVEVNGTLYIAKVQAPSGEQPLNYGKITVNEGGALFMDDGTQAVPITPPTIDAFNYGTVNLLAGSSLLFNRTAHPYYDTYIAPGTAALVMETVGKADIAFTPDSFTVTGKNPSNDYVIIKGTFGSFTLPKSLTIKSGGVIAKTDIASWDMTGNEKKSITVTDGGSLTVEHRFFTDAYSAPVNALSGITVTGANSRIILSPIADFDAATAGPLVLDNGATGTFNRSGAVTTIAGTLLPTGVTAKNGATVEYVGAASYALTAGPMAYSGYKVIFDKAPTGATTIDLTNAELTAPSIVLDGNATLTNSTITFTSGTVTDGTAAGNPFSWTLVGSTVNFASMKSAFTHASSTVMALSAGSTVNVKGTLDFSGAAPVITLFDAASQITGEAGEKITDSNGTSSNKLTINAPGAATSVKGLTFTGTPPTTTEIGAGKTATWESDTLGWVLP
jgi:hypothetical protein